MTTVTLNELGMKWFWPIVGSFTIVAIILISIMIYLIISSKINGFSMVKKICQFLELNEGSTKKIITVIIIINIIGFLLVIAGIYLDIAKR